MTLGLAREIQHFLLSLIFPGNLSSYLRTRCSSQLKKLFTSVYQIVLLLMLVLVRLIKLGQAVLVRTPYEEVHDNQGWISSSKLLSSYVSKFSDAFNVTCEAYSELFNNTARNTVKIHYFRKCFANFPCAEFPRCRINA